MADDLAISARADAAKDSEETEPEFIDLFSGAVLAASEAEAITLRSRTHLVVFAGAAESGKTTILASIYERLNQGSFAGFNFAGSRSLLGFEEVCHLNRLASGGDEPDTPRTRHTEDVGFYHITLRAMAPAAERRELLMSATSGELFRLAKDSDEEAARPTFIRRADSLVVLIDGARLATLEERVGAQADAADILESLLNAGMVSPGCRVEFVFSKRDRILAAGPAAAQFLANTQAKLQAKFRGRVPNLTFRSIAARPAVASDMTDAESGLADAFVSWTTLAPTRPDAGGDNYPVPALAEREFSKFGWRHLAGTRIAP